jgi:class 3 adenylate cyclase
MCRVTSGTEQRKLAAIMFTDMVGYRALAQRHQALAQELPEEHRRAARGIAPSSPGNCSSWNPM